MTERNSTGASASNQVKKHSTKRLTTAEFIKRAKSAHGDTYDYSKVVYKNGKAKVEIICAKHGSFFQDPFWHARGKGCPKCSLARRVKKRTYTKKDFVDKCTKLHNGKYCYKKVVYTISQAKVVITCPEHGDFEQLAAVHLLGHGCPRCAGVARLGRKAFIERAREVHGDVYDYSRVQLQIITDKVTIGCRTHGWFEQVGHYHISGSNCPQCMFDKCGWGRSKFIKNCERGGGYGILYAIQCFNNKEVFFKIGVTSQTIEQRFSGTAAMPYDYKVLYKIEGRAEVIFDMERALLRALKDNDYLPEIYFGGRTECFATIKPVEPLLKELSTTEQLQLLA